MAGEVRILNLTRAPYVISTRRKDPQGGSVIKRTTIPSGESALMCSEEFTDACKGSIALQAMVDQKRLVIGKSSAPQTANPDTELHADRSSLERPPELTDTANAEQGKVKHEVKSIESVEVPAPAKAKNAPSGGKRAKG